MASDNRLSAAVFGPKWLVTTGCQQPLPCFYIPVKFLLTHEYKKPKRWHANMYMISQKNYNHLFAAKHM